MKALGNRNAITVFIIKEWRLAINENFKKWQSVKASFIFFQIDDAFQSSFYYVCGLMFFSSSLLYVSFLHYFLSFPNCSFAAETGCLPVSWSKPLSGELIWTFLQYNPCNFPLGPQMVLRSCFVAKGSLSPGFGVNLETCPCGGNLFLFKGMNTLSSSELVLSFKI